MVTPAAPGAAVPGPVRLVARLLRPRALALGVAIGLGILAAGASLSQPVLVGGLVSELQDGGIAPGSIARFVAVFVAEALLLGLQAYVLGVTGSRVVLDLRRRLARTLLRAPMSVHADLRTGDTLTRLVTDTSMMRTTLTQALAVVVLSLVTVLGAIVLMLVIDVVLTLVLAACIALTTVASLVVSSRVRGATHDMLSHAGDLGAALQRALGGIVTVKLSRAEDREAARLARHAEAAHDSGVRAVRLAALMTPVANGGVQATFALVFTLGASRAAAGHLGVGELASFLLLLFYLVSPLVALFSAIAQLQQGLAATARVAVVLDLPDESREAAVADPPALREPALSEPGLPEPALRVRGLTFGYGDRPVLRGLDLDVPARGVTAIVGASGAGKSTLLVLLARLWDPPPGSVTLQGRDVRAVPLPELRRRVALVEQEAGLLDASIRENVLLAAPDADDHALAVALERADLTRWVESLPDGLDTQVGERGTAVSGGQRQRIAVARMLLLDPDVLVLDEATAHLDSDSEHALRRAVQEIARERAVLVVAHRLSTVTQADVIHVVEEGRVVASGPHRELLAHETYRRLVRHQLLDAGDDPVAGREVVEVTG
ncbi:MAG: ABC transporter ATP-binding protein [Cellulomonas sp.]|uniref:ABC transporter ATP-binding protein n=1 Tax=Cellulomonas sp. TaxID=40001 RepID=UPI0019D8BB74|nr:ABC transporter ATP-binding protein [Cellulomonas sp.]MBF0688244.1 ABC transporter ATP-binding protein [Cellulomonas sp.]